MSASARGTATDYSKGPVIRRGDLAAWRGLLTALALAGAALLVAAELSPLYTVVVGALQTPRRSVSGGEAHGYGLLIVALAGAAMAYGVLRGSRAAGGALVAAGAVALLVALAIDVPDTRDSSPQPEAIAYADARAKAGTGFELEIAGGIALIVAGGLALVLGFSPRSRSSRSREPAAPEPQATSRRRSGPSA
ncbi:MAG: hypothetical protein QOG15_1416 [Solirubrobacteraceae bacterium]|nr:hypothetical protein [Solirubrobacteraceae bacterium]